MTRNYELDRARGLGGRGIRATTSTPETVEAERIARAYEIPRAQALAEVRANRAEARLPLYAGPAGPAGGAAR
ncbi:MAG: hypothetical protein OXC08_20800 [Thiotrichales bacterium]|nr:hypothetical protein [Thiotrichales bacterium]